MGSITRFETSLVLVVALPDKNIPPLTKEWWTVQFLTYDRVTACILFPQENPRQFIYSGKTTRHPKDEPDYYFAYRVSARRACSQIDSKWDGGLGKMGREIYRAIRVELKKIEQL
jgi:hypothetical protein